MEAEAEEEEAEEEEEKEGKVNLGHVFRVPHNGMAIVVFSSSPNVLCSRRSDSPCTP